MIFLRGVIHFIHVHDLQVYIIWYFFYIYPDFIIQQNIFYVNIFFKNILVTLKYLSIGALQTGRDITKSNKSNIDND